MDARATLLAAIAAGPKQFDRLLHLHTPMGPDVLVAEVLDGFESVDGGGFRLKLDALSVDAHLPVDELLGQPVLLELLTAESAASRRPFHGHVTAGERALAAMAASRVIASSSSPGWRSCASAWTAMSFRT